MELNVKCLIRKIKISKLLNQPLIGLEQKFVEEISYKLKDLIIFDKSEINNSIYFMNKKHEYVLEIKLKQNDDSNVYIRDEIIDPMLKIYPITEWDMLSIIQYLLESKYKDFLKEHEIEIKSFQKSAINWNHWIEEEYKIKRKEEVKRLYQRKLW